MDPTPSKDSGSKRGRAQNQRGRGGKKYVPPSERVSIRREEILRERLVGLLNSLYPSTIEDRVMHIIVNKISPLVLDSDDNARCIAKYNALEKFLTENRPSVDKRDKEEFWRAVTNVLNDPSTTTSSNTTSPSRVAATTTQNNNVTVNQRQQERSTSSEITPVHNNVASPPIVQIETVLESLNVLKRLESDFKEKDKREYLH
jgi:hypothetical protein